MLMHVLVAMLEIPEFVEDAVTHSKFQIINYSIQIKSPPIIVG